MPFDIIGAKQAGFSDEEIAQEMASKFGFDYAGAIAEGFTVPQILGEMSSRADVGDGDESFGSRVARDLSKRKEKTMSMVRRNAATPYQAIINAPAIGALGAGQIAGGINDIVLEGLKSGYNALSQGVKDVVVNDPLEYWGSTKAGQMASNAAGMVGDAAAKFAEAYPDAAMAVEGAGNIAGAGPVVRGAGIAGRAGAQGAGRAIQATGSGAAELIGGLGTRTGGQTLKDAARRGFAGGESGARFAAQMRGRSDLGDVVTKFKGALDTMRNKRAAAYRSGMVDISNDKAVLDFGPIEKTVADVEKIGTYKGKVINRSAADTKQKIFDVVEEWKSAEPTEFHTPEGLDALKRTIGDIRDSTELGTPSRKVADSVYHSIKNEIVKQAPEYSKVMADYSKASELIKEIEKTFSAGGKSTPDTAIRKLLSLTRNNASTNYGNRITLAKEIEAAGYPDLLSDLSAHALNSWSSRGIGGVVQGVTAAGGLGTLNPAAIPIIALQSPRLMGETAYLLGTGAGKIKRGLLGQ